MIPKEFAGALWRYCTAVQGSVTSYIRTEAHNRAVGGVEGSPHVAGVGADVVYDAGAITPRMREMVAEGLGLEIVHEADHDHLQPAGWRNTA